MNNNMNNNRNDIRIQEELKDEHTLEIYKSNKNKNKEKLLFFNFLIYNTKIDIHIEEVQSYLFWVGMLEYLVWTVLLAVFISSPKMMAGIWIYFYHNARATIGLFILKYIPKTHHVIENLRDYENSNLEDIQKQMEQNYISLIHDNERVLRPLLIIYFILTILSIVVDIILICIVTIHFSDRGFEAKEFVLLLANIAFIGMYIYFILVGDFIYFTFLGSLRFNFPPETLSAIRKLSFGYFGQLKTGIANGFTGLVNRFRNRAVTAAVSNS